MSEELVFGLYGSTYGFCGVDGNVVILKNLEERRMFAFEVVEDEDDGYRSSMKELKPVDYTKYVYFFEPIVNVRVQEMKDNDIDGWQLIDDKNRVWLQFGTEAYDDYYPCFLFRYTPQE